MSEIRTYTLHDYTVPDPDGCRDVTLPRALVVTVGSQALEPGIVGGKTLLRFCLPGSNPLLERKPKMRLTVFSNDAVSGQPCTPVVFNDPLFVEMLFDNSTFLTERKEMPYWLVDALEFAAKTLRAQCELSQLGIETEFIE